jgi:hypothetical protein
VGDRSALFRGLRGRDRQARLTVFQLPACASELNPVEGMWSVLNRSLANLAKRDIGQLTVMAKTWPRRMRYRRGLVEGFLAETRLDSTPFCNRQLKIVRLAGCPGLTNEVSYEQININRAEVMQRRRTKKTKRANPERAGS